MITNADYVFVEKDPNETSYVKLVGECPWNGTIFQYGNLRVKVDEEADEAHLEFSYNIMESPLQIDMLNDDVGFKNYIGDILQHIIVDALSTGEYAIGRKDSDNDIEELDNE